VFVHLCDVTSRAHTSTSQGSGALPNPPTQSPNYGNRASESVTSVFGNVSSVAVKPFAGVAGALAIVALGFRNGLNPTARVDEEQLWNVTHDRDVGSSRRARDGVYPITENQRGSNKSRNSADRGYDRS